MGTLPPKLSSIRIGQLDIPFRESFRHTSHERSGTATVVVVVQSTEGLVGYGEGCPRSYVTGETLESALDFLQTFQAQVPQKISIHMIRALGETFKNEVDRNPAAFCALEMALLDLLGKSQGIAVEELIAIPRGHAMPPCSFVVGLGPLKQRLRKWKLGWRLGFRHFKFKIEGTQEDLTFLNSLVANTPGFGWPNKTTIKIRLDGNGCFAGLTEAVDFFQRLNLPISGIEEPLAPGYCIETLVELAKKLETLIILDEGFTRFEQLETIKLYKEHLILNIRVSKLGGILRTHRICEAATRSGIRFAIGCQVGETSLLTRAALIFVGENPTNSPVSFEGGFSPHLLQRDPATPPIGFRLGGRLKLKNRFNFKPGLGLQLSSDFIRP